MTDFDDLDDLKSAMDATTPVPDAARRAENIALAQKNFESLQGSADGARPTVNGPATGPISGVRKMFNALTTRGALTATTGLAAIGLVFVVPQLMQQPPLIQVPLPSGILRPEADEGTVADVSAPAPTVAPSVAPVMEEPEMRAMEAPITTLKQSAPASMPAPAPMVERRERTLGLTDGIIGGLASGAPVNGFAADMRADSDDRIALAEPDTEAFPDVAPNPLKITSEEPVSTFSIDVDTASYSIVRSSLMGGRMPAPESVRIEEMVNYFPYDYLAPENAPIVPPFART